MKEWIYVMPGIAGSQLGLGTTVEKAKENILWVNKFQLAICKFSKLAVKFNEPVPAIRPVNLYREIYGALIETMRKFCMTHMEGGARRFHDVVTLPYDWRLSIIDNGKLLAELLKQQWSKTPGQKTTIVAHSMGGLVARAAYRYLVDELKGDYIRRIITIGSPHIGSYGLCQTFAGNDENVKSLAQAKALIFGRFDIVGIGDAPMDRVLQVVTTWPGGYELLMKYNWSPAEDPLNPEAYKASNYASQIQVQQSLMDRSKEDFWPWISDELFWPGPDVMRVIVGYGTPTPTYIVDPGKLASSNAAFKYGDGDGTVSVHSASFPGAGLKGQTLVASKHNYLPADRRVLNALPELILEESEKLEPADIGINMAPSQRAPAKPAAPTQSTPNGGAQGEYPWLVCN